MWAILSDIHGNLEALDAVMADMQRFAVDRVYCLGDTVGYGPNQLECVQQLESFYVALMGEFEEAFFFDPDDLAWPPSAVRSMECLRTDLDTATSGVRERITKLLKGLPKVHSEPDVIMVHGSPRSPLYEYVFPDDVHQKDKMSTLFSFFERWCFCGNTHMPGVFLENMKGKKWSFLPPEGADHLFSFSEQEHRAICNVGAVGRSRDGDNRACYVLFDGQSVRFRRVEYDIQKTAAKTRRIACLHPFLADGLLEGLM